jgi:electron transfer flavoprotein beta subunit
MRVVVLVKQVPATTEVQIDPEKGTLRREGVQSRTNPYDLYAVEIALRICDATNGSVTAVTMGPPQAQAVIREAYELGVDDGVLLTDRAFAGADTLATSFTLAQALKAIAPQVIVAGMQSTDGDTAQVGPGIAEWMGVPHASYVREIKEVDEDHLTVVTDMGSTRQTIRLSYPCLITVTKDVGTPRLPSYLLRKATKNKSITTLGLADMPPCDAPYYGLDGSPTQVERVVVPEKRSDRKTVDGTPDEIAKALREVLKEVCGL